MRFAVAARRIGEDCAAGLPSLMFCCKRCLERWCSSLATSALLSNHPSTPVRILIRGTKVLQLIAACPLSSYLSSQSRCVPGRGVHAERGHFHPASVSVACRAFIADGVELPAAVPLRLEPDTGRRLRLPLRVCEVIVHSDPDMLIPLCYVM